MHSACWCVWVFEPRRSDDHAEGPTATTCAAEFHPRKLFPQAHVRRRGDGREPVRHFICSWDRAERHKKSAQQQASHRSVRGHARSSSCSLEEMRSAGQQTRHMIPGLQRLPTATSTSEEETSMRVPRTTQMNHRTMRARPDKGRSFGRETNW